MFKNVFKNLQRRLRISIWLSQRTCSTQTVTGCRRLLDAYEDHFAACPRPGFLPRRAGPIERVWIRVAREAGARVVPKQLLRDLICRWPVQTTKDSAMWSYMVSLQTAQPSAATQPWSLPFAGMGTLLPGLPTQTVQPFIELFDASTNDTPS